jgi:hypothetical protein
VGGVIDEFEGFVEAVVFEGVGDVAIDLYILCGAFHDVIYYELFINES